MTELEITLKSPIYDDFKIIVDSSWDILALKHQISKKYYNNPEVLSQKLIYMGRLLKDEQILKDLFIEDMDQHFIYIICSADKFGKEKLNDTSNAKISTPVYSPEFNQIWQRSYYDAWAAYCASYHQLSLYQNAGPSPYTAQNQMTSMPLPFYNPYYYNFYNYNNMWTTPIMGTNTVNNNQAAGTNIVNSYQTQQPNNINMNNNNNNNFINNLVNGLNNNNPNQNNNEVPPAQGVRQPLMRPNIDWLDYGYILMRIALLLTVLYFYSSVNRFLIVLLIATLIFLYQAGLLLTPMGNPLRNNQNNNVENRNLPQEPNVEQNPPSTSNNNTADVPSTSQQYDEQTITPTKISTDDNGNTQSINTQNEFVQPHPQQTALVQCLNQKLTAFWSGTKTVLYIFMTFVTSLIPERPPPLD